jgi:hypothetical protein
VVDIIPTSEFIFLVDVCCLLVSLVTCISIPIEKMFLVWNIVTLFQDDCASNFRSPDLNKIRFCGKQCTIVFVISLQCVHNYLFEIHFFQLHQKNRMINKCAKDVVMSTVVCEKKLFQCCLSDLYNA